jgi:hypothetical protein
VNVRVRVRFPSIDAHPLMAMEVIIYLPGCAAAGGDISACIAVQHAAAAVPADSCSDEQRELLSLLQW